MQPSVSSALYMAAEVALSMPSMRLEKKPGDSGLGLTTISLT